MKRILLAVILCILLIGCSREVIVPAGYEESQETTPEPTEPEKEPEPEPIRFMEKGVLYEFKGKEIVLADVSPQVSYCRIRIGEEVLTITIGSERSTDDISIRVLSASIDPKRVCEVEIN
jgi:PBP1b-binding outer membrane lipoprotein LpoB